MTPSETMQVTGGTLDEDVSLRFVMRSLKGTMHVLVVDSHSDGMSCVTSLLVGGSPSGIVLN